jgi:peroxiredoxin/predicted 2-oxoglutarate/Fe(II)-dependent dioxygenase YbiX
MPDFQLMDETHTGRSLLSLALGKPIVVLCYPDNRTSLVRDVLQAFAQTNGRWGGRASVIAINGESVEENAQFREAMALPFAVLADPENRVTSLYDIRRRSLQGEDQVPGASVACVVADANRRILKMCHSVTDAGYVNEVLQFVESLPAETPRQVAVHAPVLVVPGVFDRDFCRRLIQLYETGGSEATGVSRGDHRGRPHVLDPNSKVRRDHIVTDDATNGEIRALLSKRVIPELAKVFDFQPKRGEQFKIACYDATEGGFFEPHRDNVDPAGGRRFAMSLNLNSGEFEGGNLRFLEYGPHLYCPAAGDALIFSCRLVHEAMPVTAGRRFVLLTFFHG